jgi:hypothetical protein
MIVVESTGNGISVPRFPVLMKTSCDQTHFPYEYSCMTGPEHPVESF